MNSYESWDFEPKREYEERGTVTQRDDSAWDGSFKEWKNKVWEDVATGLLVSNRESFEEWIGGGGAHVSH